MPLRELQSFDSSETLRKLQRLVQLSNTPLVRVSTAALTRYQPWIMRILFMVTLIFAIHNHAPWLTIKRQVAIKFFSAVSAVVTTVGPIKRIVAGNSEIQRRYLAIFPTGHGDQEKPVQVQLGLKSM